MEYDEQALFNKPHFVKMDVLKNNNFYPISASNCDDCVAKTICGIPFDDFNKICNSHHISMSLLSTKKIDSDSMCTKILWVSQDIWQ